MTLDAFHKQQYLNLETFRKNGESMRTPVWFVQEAGTIYIRTIANSGKVKRIRNNSHVNVAPCKVDGELLGEWMPATGREVTDESTQKKVDQLLDKKYGLLKKMFSLTSSLQGKKNTVLEIKFSDSPPAEN